MASARYSFGDGDVPSTRLALVAQAFDPPTAAFLDRAAPSAAGVVVDLGCGPGFTTALLADAVSSRRLVAVDASDDFLRRVRERVPSAETVVHDVTVMPLPAAPADVIFARLLLAHLPSVDAVARQWRSQLTPGGVLLLDEIDWIQSDVDVLADYEDVVVDLVAARGGAMYAGPLLDAFVADAAADGGLAVDLRFERPVDPALAASMFAMNLSVWRDDPAVAAHARSGRLDRLATGLAEIAAEARGSITWGLRQVAVGAAVPSGSGPGGATG